MKPDLSAPLKPDTEYYDATPALEEATEALKLADDRIAKIEAMMERQLDINVKLINYLNNLIERVAGLENKKPSIIIPERLNS